jgi:enoyl-CoA hydratase/carnithine racemase
MVLLAAAWQEVNPDYTRRPEPSDMLAALQTASAASTASTADSPGSLRNTGMHKRSMPMFNSYCDKYENVRMKREDGILEVALHTQGDPLVFNGYVHEALVGAFRDIGDDPENHVVILTGTGSEFCAQITGDGFDFFTPSGYDKILREGTKVLENILDIQVPMIAAINGPVTAHSEYALLCDIVIAAENAYFQDAPHPAFGIVPGDGLHIVWPEVIGEIRGRYFLLSGQKLSAVEARAYGAVNEVVSREALLPRAWELAQHMKKQNPLTLRYTRMALSNRFRRRLQEELSYGLALEGISAAQVALLNAQQAKG